MTDILDRIDVWADGDKDTRALIEDCAAEIKALRKQVLSLEVDLELLEHGGGFGI